MYKLLIVEDEEMIRKGLVSAIDWESHNIKICAYASNGIDALLYFEKHQPDIILTDIQMPKMSGLELIQQAKNAGFNFEAIILTGYKDFNYAKQSIHLKVFDYILKPAQPDEILATVLKVAGKIKQKEFMNHQLDLLEHYNDQNMYIAKIEVLNNWLLRSNQLSIDDRKKIIKELQVNVDIHNIHVGMIHFPNPNEPSYIKDQDLLKFAFINITTETLSPFYTGKIEVFFNQNQLIWIGNSRLSSKSNELNHYLTQLVKNFDLFLKQPIYIGVGNIRESIDEMHQSYVEAKRALDEHYYHKDKNAFFYADLVDFEARQILDDKDLSSLEEQFLSSMFNKKYNEALDNLERWLKHLEKGPFYHKDQVNLKAFTLIVEMQKFVYGDQLTRIEWENDLVNWIEQVPTMKTFDDMSSIIKKIFKNVFEILTSERPIHRTIRHSQKIIKQRYHEHLTLETIANEVFVSSAYLSSLFKQELGINFLDYLHQYRISQAKPLLSQNYLIYEIARKVGYKDERHFSSTFKKWIGITPTQYQKRA